MKLRELLSSLVMVVTLFVSTMGCGENNRFDPANPQQIAMYSDVARMSATASVGTTLITQKVSLSDTTKLASALTATKSAVSADTFDMTKVKDAVNAIAVILYEGDNLNIINTIIPNTLGIVDTLIPLAELNEQDKTKIEFARKITVAALQGAIDACNDYIAKGAK